MANGLHVATLVQRTTPIQKLYWMNMPVPNGVAVYVSCAMRQYILHSNALCVNRRNEEGKGEMERVRGREREMRGKDFDNCHFDGIIE